MVYIARNTEEEMKNKENPVSPAKAALSASGGEVLNQLTPKTALVVGLVGSVMALCTVGFVVLLWLVFR